DPLCPSAADPRCAGAIRPLACPAGAGAVMSDSKPSPVSAIASLRKAFAFLLPYRLQMGLATVALVFTAAITLLLVQFVRVIVDAGFVTGSNQSLGLAIGGFFVVAVLQALGTFARFYWVSWLGER